MVRGLDLFREHFREYAGQYMLIGGTACTVLMEDIGTDFRPTKDIDIVLCAEALTGDFYKAFWTFIQTGGYKVWQRSDGKPQLYRFVNPADDTYPKMLEIFARRPDFTLPDDARFAPIPIEDEAYSLSGILLDDDYYQFICEGAMTIDGITIVEPGHLIPLKVRAFLDLRQRREAGEPVDSKNVLKHRDDVFRLLAGAFQTPKIKLPGTMLQEVEQFTALVREENLSMRVMQITNHTLDELIGTLASMYL